VSKACLHLGYAKRNHQQRYDDDASWAVLIHTLSSYWKNIGD
jgi:hypothetical protein